MTSRYRTKRSPLHFLEVGDNAYFAASYVADTIAAKYSRRVTTKLDGALSAEYSDLADQYRKLSVFLRQQGQKYSGGSLGIPTVASRSLT
jgi:hypothetical protein